MEGKRRGGRPEKLSTAAEQSLKVMTLGKQEEKGDLRRHLALQLSQSLIQNGLRGRMPVKKLFLREGKSQSHIT